MTPNGTVETFEEYLGKIEAIYANGFEIFYRGHSNMSYTLAPSIYRKFEKIDNAINFEDTIFRELIIHNPGEFENEATTLEKLALMQHSGLPTRLLDVTANPLVALYFCCCNLNANTDGSVVIIKTPPSDVKYYDSDTVAILANLARLTPSEKAGIDLSLDKARFNQSEVIQRLIHYVIQEKHHFREIVDPKDLHKVLLVKPKRTNRRIFSQSGAFLLFGLFDRFILNVSQGRIEIEHIIVSRFKKGEMISRLDKLGINDRSMFPQLDTSAKYIKDRYLGMQK